MVTRNQVTPKHFVARLGGQDRERLNPQKPLIRQRVSQVHVWAWLVTGVEQILMGATS